MKKNLLMPCSLAAVAIGAEDIVNALQAGTTISPIGGVISTALGIVGFIGHALRGYTGPATTDI